MPYNISSQILIKILKINNLKDKLSDIIFMFQKELGQKIIGDFQSSDYGRLSIITNFRFYIKDKFLVSATVFPKPKLRLWLYIFSQKKIISK